MSQLDDGVYEAIVIDAKEFADDVLQIALALSSGPHKGDVIEVSATHLRRSWTDVLGTPATITVVNGEPHIDFE